MTIASRSDPVPRTRAIIVGIVLLDLGLAGHVVAAWLHGGDAVSYGHHIGGFAILTVAATLLCAPLQWFFWRGRDLVTLIVVGAVQLIMGAVVVALELHH